MTNPLGGLLEHSLLGRALGHLANNVQGGPGGDSLGLPGGLPGSSGDDAPSPPQLPPGGPEGRHGGATTPPMGGPPLPQGPPSPTTGGPSLLQSPQGPITGGPSLSQGVWAPSPGSPVPHGMQNVFPNIVQQIGGVQSPGAVPGQVAAAATVAAPAVVPAPGYATGAAQPQLPPAASAAHAQPLGGGVPAAAHGLPAAQTSPTASLATTAPAAVAAAQAGTLLPATPAAVAPPPGSSESMPLAAGRPGDTAMPPRAEGLPLLARLAAALQLGAVAPPTIAPAAPSPGTPQTLNVAGLTTAPMAMPPTDARGAILPANDNAAMRRDIGPIAIAGHTLEGTQRRLARQRAYLLPQGLTRWLIAVGGTGAQLEDADSAQRALERAFQWLFWILMIVAYGCLAATVVALVGADGGLGTSGYGAGRAYAAGFALFGLLAGAAAWWLVRSMTRR